MINRQTFHISQNSNNSQSSKSFLSFLALLPIHNHRSNKVKRDRSVNLGISSGFTGLGGFRVGLGSRLQPSSRVFYRPSAPSAGGGVCLVIG